MRCAGADESVPFGGAVNEDRLGSAVKHFPYGEEPATTGQDRVKFATYYRDATTTLDYADQRYYLRTIGRFLTADPYRGSAGPAGPQSWNRYAYVQGDPVNFLDPGGLDYFSVHWFAVCAYATWDGSWEWLCGDSDPTRAYVGVEAPRKGSWRAGRGGREAPADATKRALALVHEDFEAAVREGSVFKVEHLDCISGIETGRTWNPKITSIGGRIGLFQFNAESWRYSGTGIAWDAGEAAKEPLTAVTVALALLYRNLGYAGVQNPTAEAVREAIDKFGEHDGRYGQAVMDCASKLLSGDFPGAMSVLEDYATWVAKGRP